MVHLHKAHGTMQIQLSIFHIRFMNGNLTADFRRKKNASNVNTHRRAGKSDYIIIGKKGINAQNCYPDNLELLKNKYEITVVKLINFAFNHLTPDLCK